jgi:hypothetical protein
MNAGEFPPALQEANYASGNNDCAECAAWVAATKVIE